MKTDRILIVDDEELNRFLLEGILEVLGYECRSASNGVEALRVLDSDIDLVLLDVNMPELTGFDVVRKIRLADQCNDVPVVMVTALSSMQDRLAAVEAGANDFISKPVDQTELRIRIASQLRIKHSQDEVKRHQVDLESQVQTRTSELESANQKLAQLATTDTVTGLANHRSLVSSLDAEVSRCAATHSTCSVLFIDLDYFKALNDSCGHVAGDEVLNEVGATLEEAIRGRGICGRWGGEEFVCILPDTDGEKAVELAESVREQIARRSFGAALSCHLTCSVGVASYPRDGLDRSTLAEAADKAMYVAKSLGRNQVRAAEDVSSGFESLRFDCSSREDQALSGLVEALVALVNMRDECSGKHIEDVEVLSREIGIALGMADAEIRLLGIAGKLHDIGKVAISDAILTKGTALSTEEWSSVKQHPRIGADVLARVPSLRAIAAAVRSHHECWDGSGYPDGLIGDEIPVAAQIISVADAYSAMTSSRPYREPMTHDAALSEIRRCRGTQFSPTVVDALELSFRTKGIQAAA
jgi:diguanylate cyclase (GGDEF)-like protein